METVTVNRENIRDRLIYDLKNPGVVFVDAQDVAYVDERLLWPIEESEGRRVVVIADNRGDLMEYFEEGGIEPTGNGFATLICKIAKVKCDNNDYLTRDQAYKRAKQEMRFRGTTMFFWNSEVDALDLKTGEQRIVNLVEFTLNDNLITEEFITWRREAGVKVKSPSIKIGTPQETVVYASR